MYRAVLRILCMYDGTIRGNDKTRRSRDRGDLLVLQILHVCSSLGLILDETTGFFICENDREKAERHSRTCSRSIISRTIKTFMDARPRFKQRFRFASDPSPTGAVRVDMEENRHEISAEKRRDRSSEFRASIDLVTVFSRGECESKCNTQVDHRTACTGRARVSRQWIAWHNSECGRVVK